MTSNGAISTATGCNLDFTKARLIRDGEAVAVAQPATYDAIRLTFHDRTTTDAAHTYYAEIRQEPEPGLNYPGIAWTSPVWITPG